jgi:hypothetical protein
MAFFDSWLSLIAQAIGRQKPYTGPATIGPHVNVQLRTIVGPPIVGRPINGSTGGPALPASMPSPTPNASDEDDPFINDETKGALVAVGSGALAGASAGYKLGGFWGGVAGGAVGAFSSTSAVSDQLETSKVGRNVENVVNPLAGADSAGEVVLNMVAPWRNWFGNAPRSDDADRAHRE